MQIHVKPSKIAGTLRLPPSKSQTFRALIFASQACGTSYIENYLESPDTDCLIENLRELGAAVEKTSSSLVIEGNKGILKNPKKPLQVGNSGINFRFLTGLCALSHYPIIIDGDDSIRRARDIEPLVRGLRQLGVVCETPKGLNAPLTIKGPILGDVAHIEGQDSQFVSALLVAFSLGRKKKHFHVASPGELPWVDLTLSWLKKFNVPYKNDSYCHYEVEGTPISGFHYKVPSDFSSATYPLAAALMTKSRLTLEGLDFADLQGDKNFIPVLQSLGAHIEIDRAGLLKIYGENGLRGGIVDVNPCIDCLPLFACLGTYGLSPLSLINGHIARTKECDRICCIRKELEKMGAKIQEKKDGLVIYPSRLQGSILSSHNDHRMALSLSVAALGAISPSLIENANCINKTYKNFVKDFQRLGAEISC